MVNVSAKNIVSYVVECGREAMVNIIQRITFIKTLFLCYKNLITSKDTSQ